MNQSSATCLLALLAALCATSCHPDKARQNAAPAAKDAADREAASTAAATISRGTWPHGACQTRCRTSASFRTEAFLEATGQGSCTTSGMAPRKTTSCFAIRSQATSATTLTAPEQSSDRVRFAVRGVCIERRSATLRQQNFCTKQHGPGKTNARLRGVLSDAASCATGDIACLKFRHPRTRSSGLSGGLP